MAPRHSPLACPETLLEEVDTDGDTAQVTPSETFGGYQWEEVVLLPPVTRLFEDDSQPLESDSDPEESDDESDKENQDPNGGSNTQAIAVAREGQLPREEDYFDARVVTELEELGNTWRQFMGGALRAPQPHSPSITELYSEPH